MGYAQIVGGGPTARYTLRLDYGEATKTATLAALNAQLAKLDTNLAAAEVKLSQAEADAAAARTAVNDATNVFISAGGTQNLSDNAVQAALRFLEEQRKAIVKTQMAVVQPRLQRDALKVERAKVLDMIVRWNAAVVTQTKDAWCTDYTESGAGYVATIDIDNESSLTLLAPGCRPWQGSDGNISTAVKNAKLTELTTKQSQLLETLLDLEDDLLDAKQAEEDAQLLRRGAYLAFSEALYTPGEKAALDALVAADARLREAKTELTELLIAHSQLEARKAKIDAEVALWQAKPAIENPVAGDGVMYATDVMSPEQCYWNLAALPAVQKFKPTYRWGTLTALDKDANTASVSLNAATSSQQSLGINQSTTLTGIPVVYMTCNARAFEIGDRVVVQFQGQDWANPRVIGFLDNPRPCVQYVASYYVIGYGPLSSGNLHLFDTLERGEDELWGNFSTITPVAPWKFIQWSDGVTSLMRNDGTATESISRTARYTYAPNFRVTYTWTVEAYATSGTYFDGSNFVKDWEVKVTGSVAWSAIGYATPPTSPASAAIDSVVWSGQALDSIGPDQVMFNLTDTYLGETSSAGPLYFPAFPSSTTQTAVFVLAGSANQYSVVGNAGTNPFPGGVIPSSASDTGAVTTIDYTATSWSAVYA